MHLLKTIDIWDTLLRRRCHPESVKRATARRVWLQQFNNLQAEFQNLEQLHRARVESESKLAKAAKESGHDDEYHIVEVIKTWLQDVLTPAAIARFGAQHLSEESESLADFELLFEMQHTYADPDIRAFLEQFPSERSLYLSDFYMDGARLSRLLSHHGLSDIVPDGFVSCDIGKNKRSGALFSYVHERIGISAQAHVHIGDNHYSDVTVPEQLGIRAVHFLPSSSPQHAARLEHEENFHNRERLFFSLETKSLDAASDVTTRLSPSESAIFELGVRSAPLFIGFALFCAEQAILAGIEKLFFLTREGEFFFKLFNELFPEKTLAGVALPTTEILEVSRLATFAGSVNPADLRPGFEALWARHRMQSVSGMLRSVGLQAEDFADLLKSLELSAEEVVDGPGSDPRIAKLLAHPSFMAASRASLAQLKHRLEGYLSTRGLDGISRVGVVDIGWSGSIQNNLATAWQEMCWHGFYLAMSQSPNAAHDSAGQKLPYLFARNAETREFFDGMHILELLCTSDGGSVLGYSDASAGFAAQREINAEENEFFHKVADPFQRGVLFAAGIWKDAIARDVLMSQELIEAGKKIWLTLIRQPLPELAEGILHTPQHDMLIFGDYFKRSKAPRLRNYLAAFVSSSARQELKTFVRRFQWAESVEYLKELSRIERGALRLLLTLVKLGQATKLRLAPFRQ